MKRKLGFTILEMIGMLVILGAVSAMIIPFFHSGVTGAYEPIQDLSAASGFNSVMANMVADYDDSHDSAASLADFKTNIGSDDNSTVRNNDYGQYIVEESVYVTTMGALNFDANTALRVTIRNPVHSGETLTNLFTVY